MSARLTRPQRAALDMIERADPGEVYLVNCAAFTEQGANLGNPWVQAFIHWRVARSLNRLGLVTFEGSGEYTTVHLVDRAGGASTLCPVPFCRAEAGHRTLHDIRACTRDCGPLLDGKPRAWHAKDCPNGEWLTRLAERQAVLDDERCDCGNCEINGCEVPNV